MNTEPQRTDLKQIRSRLERGIALKDDVKALLQEIQRLEQHELWSRQKSADLATRAEVAEKALHRITIESVGLIEAQKARADELEAEVQRLRMQLGGALETLQTRTP